jgi:hypothetical protein
MVASSRRLLCAALLLLTVLTACGGAKRPTATPQRVTPTPQPVAQASPTPVAPTVTTRVARSPTMTATPWSLATPTRAPVAGDERLPVIDSGWSVVERFDEVAWGFIVENLDTTQAVIDSEDAVLVYDRAGQVVATDSGFIDIVLPGARLGIGGYTVVGAGAAVEAVAFRVVAGHAGAAELQPAFTVSSVRYLSSAALQAVTATVESDAVEPLENLTVWTVARDAAGAIVGGGSGYVPFLLPGKPGGVVSSIRVAEEPAIVEVYATLSALTIWTAEDARARYDAVLPARLVEQGYSIAVTDEVSWGAVIENPNQTLALTGVVAALMAYDADGAVLARDSMYLSYVLPGGRSALGGTLVSTYGRPERVVVQVLGRVVTETRVTSEPLAVDEGEYVDAGLPVIRGTVRNLTEREVTGVRVVAVAYDAAGHIVGGMATFADDTPASGAAAFADRIALGEPPARVALYATVANLFEIGVRLTGVCRRRERNAAW